MATPCYRYGISAVLKSPRDHAMFQRSSMRRVGLIDITVGNATRLGASQRSTTRRCASHYIATQRANRLEHPAALARLARTVTLKRLWHVQRAHSLSPGRNASPIGPDLIFDRHTGRRLKSRSPFRKLVGRMFGPS